MRSFHAFFYLGVFVAVFSNAVFLVDQHLGDLHGFIVDREVEIIQELTNKVLKSEKTLVLASEVLAEIDALLAFADATRQCRYQIFAHLKTGSS